MLIPLGKYRHYKGKDYNVIGVAWDTERQEVVVLYKPLHAIPELEEELEGEVTFTRPLTEFLGNAEWEGETVPRFTLIH